MRCTYQEYLSYYALVANYEGASDDDVDADGFDVSEELVPVPKPEGVKIFDNYEEWKEQQLNEAEERDIQAAKARGMPL